MTDNPSDSFDPFDPAHVRVAGVGFGRVSADNDFGGLLVTRDGGATWVREAFVGTANHWCHQVLFDPATQAVMERYSMPTLYLDTAAYDAASREQDKIERENLRRVGMLAR